MKAAEVTAKELAAIDADDGVCRFITYNFVSDHAGGNGWTPVRFKSFCTGCPEGDTECRK